MNKAALSVMLNISEGFLRRRDGETLQFLRYSFASNGELKAAYYAAESIAKMLRRWQATLDTPDQKRRRAPRTKDQGRTKN